MPTSDLRHAGSLRSVGSVDLGMDGQIVVTDGEDPDKSIN